MNRLKRKPFMIGALACAMLLAFAAWRFAMPSAAEAPRLEQNLPADTVAFVQVSNLRAQALNIIDSEAWRAFSRENQTASSLFMMTVNHTGALDASYALALLGVEANADGKPEPGFVVVAEFDGAGARRTFENRVLRMARESGEKGVEPKVEEYGDAKINLISKDAQHGFAYAQTGNALLLSNGVGPIKQVLDVRAGKAKSLESNETFLQARARTASREGMFGFVDGAALSRMVENAPTAKANGEAASFQQLFQGLGLKSVESIAMSSAFADGRVVERASVAAPRAEGVLHTIAQNPPTQQALLALVPANALQAFDASVAGAPQVFDEMLGLAQQAAAHGDKKNLGDALREMTEKTGIDFRGEILGALGAEICVAQLADGERRSGVVILNLKDEASFAQALEKIAAQKKAVLSARDYKGVTIRSLVGEKGHGLHYAFLNGNFIASGETFGVESALDTAQSGVSLAASASFRQASAGAEGSPQFVYYNSNADYVSRLGAMLSNKEHEFKTEGVGAGIRPSFAFGVARADSFYIESRSPLGTFPRVLTGLTAKLSGEKTEKKESAAAE